MNATLHAAACELLLSELDAKFPQEALAAACWLLDNSDRYTLSVFETVMAILQYRFASDLEQWETFLAHQTGHVTAGSAEVARVLALVEQREAA